MAASDHLHPKLFHGTSTWLKPGDVITPGVSDFHYGHNGESKKPENQGIGAYAATDMDTAEGFSKSSAFRYRHEKEANGGEPYQYELFSPVYEVEHSSENHDPENILPSNYKRDMSGFRVKGIAKYANIENYNPNSDFSMKPEVKTKYPQEEEYG